MSGSNPIYLILEFSANGEDAATLEARQSLVKDTITQARGLAWDPVQKPNNTNYSDEARQSINGQANCTKEDALAAVSEMFGEAFEVNTRPEGCPMYDKAVGQFPSVFIELKAA